MSFATSTSAKVLSLAMVVLVAAGVWFLRRGAPPEEPAVAPAPLVSNLRVEGRTIRSDRFAMELIVPEPWEFLNTPKQPGLDVAVRDPLSGTVFIGYGLDAAATDGVDAVLEQMVEQRRRQFPIASDVAWANRRAGGLELRSVAVTVQPSSGPASRTELMLAKRDIHLLGFNCSAPPATFATSEKLCLGLLERLKPLRPLP